MSMLSAQCDELRAMAASVGLEVPQAATLMMDAADTIWELRESVHKERAEADRLRTQLADVTVSMGRVEERCAKFRDENAKLRELVRDVNKDAHMLCEAWEGSCSKEAEGMSLHAVCPIGDTNELCVFGKLADRMRELGVRE